MAKPRVFVSSTYYDLKYIRNDLERFIKEQGYDPVLNEKGNIPYGSEKRLEEYCYKEIEICDIVVGVIGGRFGSQSQHGNSSHSVSNVELTTAVKKGKQLYIFIEKTVYAEYQTYKVNKDNDSIKYASVDDNRIFQFLDEIHSLPNNNQIQAFESVVDITNHLKEQWAGLFQSLLSESSRRKEVNLIDEINRTSATLKTLVTFLSEEKNRGSDAIQNILMNSHPAFSELRTKLGIGHRVYFQNIQELGEILKTYGYKEYEFPFGSDLSWYNNSFELTISEEIFDENKSLKVYTPENWNSAFITIEKRTVQVPPPPPSSDFDDDIPF
ncbi:DUF4062 domain-containing protein [Vibrio cortegadensis]|uniref:DUF4062 domain-containing protein n=1 Tax=Vibrio cortegadensis TaxID=1328770 RepID=UPI0021C43200|nr:DUF4062 domain-containing protein [Vibrio cortegadensis]MDN3697785.1 DUF4062 domain-containing protein [Vibrio cortegadensis]